MSVQSEIDRIITAVGNAYSKVSEKGGTVPASQTVANLATAIDSIPAGGGAPSLQSKSVTYTANGTATITPDDGYDGLSSVDVTVNVSGGGSIGEIFRGEVIPTKETPPSELFVTLPHGEQMTITDLFSVSVDNIWNKVVLNGDAVSFLIINTTDTHVYTGLQIKQINIAFYMDAGKKRRRAWRRCLNGASYSSIADTLCFKTGSKYVYYWI